MSEQKAKKRTTKRTTGTTPRKRRITFTLSAEAGHKVAVSGDFNDWDPKGRKMVDKNGDGNYQVTMNLAPGVYEYKFIVDDTWCVDAACKDWVPNSFGTLNSVVHVE